MVFKELADNGIDNAEADTAPKISIAVTITDYGAGIDREDLARVLDYNNRVSSTPACVSPTRGQQGSALQAVLAILFALDDERGETISESRGITHSMGNRLRRQPASWMRPVVSAPGTGARTLVPFNRAATRNERAARPRQYFMDVCSVRTVASGIAGSLAAPGLAMWPPGLMMR